MSDKEMYKQNYPYVGDDGFYYPLEPYSKNGCEPYYRCLMTKDMFIEAYNKWIKNNDG